MTQKYIFIYLQPPSLKEPVGGPQPRAEQKQRTISGGSSQEPDAQADCWHSLSCIWKLPFKVDTSIAIKKIRPKEKHVTRRKHVTIQYICFSKYIYTMWVSFQNRLPVFSLIPVCGILLLYTHRFQAIMKAVQKNCSTNRSAIMAWEAFASCFTAAKVHMNSAPDWLKALGLSVRRLLAAWVTACLADNHLGPFKSPAMHQGLQVLKPPYTIFCFCSVRQDRRQFPHAADDRIDVSLEAFGVNWKRSCSKLKVAKNGLKDVPQWNSFDDVPICLDESGT